MFELTPKVPMLVLPWSLRELKYRPKRITLFSADFVTSCIAAPVLEEWTKLKIMQLSTKLPRNFKWSMKNRPTDSNKPKKKRRKKQKFMREVVPRIPGESEVTVINRYVCHMLAASFGLKLCDNIRRVLMYTKRDDHDKEFYAFFRGMLPIHELCGTMTALELAKRDILGLKVPLWRMLLPAVFIHSMANLKGMKVCFKRCVSIQFIRRLYHLGLAIQK
jgi:hypothetical protein